MTIFRVGAERIVCLYGTTGEVNWGVIREETAWQILVQMEGS